VASIGRLAAKMSQELAQCKLLSLSVKSVMSVYKFLAKVTSLLIHTFHTNQMYLCVVFFPFQKLKLAPKGRVLNDIPIQQQTQGVLQSP
jgi:hypothetical protein